MLEDSEVSNAALLRTVLEQAFPNALSQLALVLIGFVTIFFVSQLHDSEILGGVGMGSMLFNILGLSLGCGLASGLDTLVSQSNGAEDYRRSGAYLQRAVVVCSSVCVPSAVILFFTEDILNAIGQTPGVSKQAGDYVRGCTISLWPMYLANILSTFLRAQTLPRPNLVATWSSNIFHIASSWFFIVYLEMEAWGAGLAFSATQIMQFTTVLCYIQFVRPGATAYSWYRWNWALATKGIREFLDKAVPCALSMWAEWWCAEIMTLLAGYLGVVALAAHTSAMWVFVLIYMAAGGIGCAGAALVGNALGARNARLAKRSAVLASAVVLAACFIIDILLLLFSKRLCGLFTEDPRVQAQMLGVLHILVFIVPMDSLQTVIDGILRGLGKQALAFKVKLFCLWGIRLPMAALLGLHTSLGVSGIWCGSVLGLAATMAMYLCVVSRVDWQGEVDALGTYKILSP